MPPNSVLVDTSLLYALNNVRDKHHDEAAMFAASDATIVYVIPDVALTEAAYMLYEWVGQRAVLEFLDSLDTPQIKLEPILIEDLRRAREIMATYADARLDFVDCCIMALSERLDITQVCTFDRRDFDVFRPQHCDYLEVLP